MDAALQLAIETSPHLDHVPRLPRGRALAAAGRLDEAEDEARNVLDLSPDWYFAIQARALLLEVAARRSEPWPQAEAEALTDELEGTQRMRLLTRVLGDRARREEDPDLARWGAEIALSSGMPMWASDAIQAGQLWNTTLGHTVAARVREMRHEVPPVWRRDWEAIPSVKSALSL
jgi:hypothetical protein